jgi:hypothetical protein
MQRLIIFLFLAVAASPLYAQLKPPARAIAPVGDPSMVVMDRGAKLEILPSKRAIPQMDASGHVVAHDIKSANSNAAMGPQQLGVVFDHARQEQGYITGEIAFKLKAGHNVSGFDRSLYPGLQKVTNPEVYVVTARTPSEFLSVLRRLQARKDLEWVEPTITYGPAAHSPDTR